MTLSEKEVIDLILAQDENDQVDFKLCYYTDLKKHELIKDIVSFANNIKMKDKYIIFGVENASWNIVGIEKTSLPDISSINDLLHTYVEPFIDIELGQFEYQGITIGFIRIPYKDLNRPYIISKEYSKNNVTSLRKGEVYIRKGATNFIANRNDLDSIYNNKGSFEINLHTREILISNIHINNVSYLTIQTRCVIQNNSARTIIVDDISLFIDCKSNVLEHNVEFVDDQKNVFTHKPETLSQIPMRLDSGDCLQKTIYCEISETAAMNLCKKAFNKQEISASLKARDVLKKEYQSKKEATRLNIADDLLKKWRC